MAGISPLRAMPGAAPRTKALTLASAQHLHSQGHITAAHHAKIKKAVAGGGAPMPAFGSLVPQSAGHYMSTPTPTGTDEGGGGL